MRQRRLAFSFLGMMLAASLASAQPPLAQPPRPQPQDPTPVPDPKPAVPKPEPAPRTPAASGRLGSDGDITVSGCLQRGPGAGPETKESGAMAGGYVLKQATTAKPADESAASSDAKAGAAKSGAARSGAKEYRLVASRDSVKLADHVGHQVEVKGRVTLQDQSPDRKGTEGSVSSSQPSGSTGVSTVPPATGTPSGVPPLVTLNASSITMVASTCSGPAS